MLVSMARCARDGVHRHIRSVAKRRFIRRDRGNPSRWGLCVLKLKDELASDATPIVGIAEGEEVEDLAGNSANRQKLGFVQIKDGIAPRLTVILSGGSGIGTGDEGLNRLTKETIDIQITSDEALRGAPRVVVICESLRWTESVDGQDVERDIDDFIANRNGTFARRPQEPSDTSYTCGYDADDDGMEDVFELTEDIGIRVRVKCGNRLGIIRRVRRRCCEMENLWWLYMVAIGRDMNASARQFPIGPQPKAISGLTPVSVPRHFWSK